MTRQTSRFSVAALAAVTALALLLPGAGLADDGDKYQERADTTWRVLPEAGVYRLTTNAKLKNLVKPTKKRRWYYHTWTPIWIPGFAESISFSGKGVKAVPLASDNPDWAQYRIEYPRIYYKQSQKLSFGYDLPPAEGTPYRIEDAYLHFCWFGSGADSGTVKFILPPGFAPITYQGKQPKVSRTADNIILTAPGKDEPSRTFACTEAFATDKLENTYLAGEDGQGLITVSAWPGDSGWADFVIGEIQTARPWLEEALSSGLPMSELMFREVSEEGRSGGTSDRHPIDGVIGIIESDLFTGIVAERLARTWFGPEHISDAWLAEGLAMWTGHAAVTGRCPVAVLPELSADEAVVGENGIVEQVAPDLAGWTEPVNGTSGSVDWQTSSYRSAVTCGIVEDAADAIGAEVMTGIVADMLASPTAVGVADWLVEIALASDAETVNAIRAAISESGLTT